MELTQEQKEYFITEYCHELEDIKYFNSKLDCKWELKSNHDECFPFELFIDGQFVDDFSRWFVSEILKR